MFRHVNRKQIICEDVMAKIRRAGGSINLYVNK